MVMYYTELSYGEAGRKGCLVVGGANDFALLDEEAAAHVVTAFAADEKLMADLIRIGQADGTIPKTVDPDAAALAFLCFTKGPTRHRQNRTQQGRDAVRGRGRDEARDLNSPHRGQEKYRHSVKDRVAAASIFCIHSNL